MSHYLRCVACLSLCFLLFGLPLSARSGEILFDSGFEAVPVGTVLLGSMQPADGSVLPADAIPLIAARFIPPASGPAEIVLMVDGVDVSGQTQFLPDELRYTPTAVLPEGPHLIEVVIGSGPAAVSSRWTFATRSLPDITEIQPSQVLHPQGSRPVIGATLADIGAGINANTVVLALDGAAVTDQIVITDGVVSYQPTQPLGDGSHTVRLQVDDFANNRNEREWVFVLTSTPEVTAFAPESRQAGGSAVEVTASFRDPATDLDPNSIRLIVDDVDVTDDAALTLSDARQGTMRYSPPTPFPEGRHHVELVVVNAMGGLAQRTWGFWIQPQSVHELVILSPAAGAAVTSSPIVFAVRPQSNVSYVDSLTINGLAAETAAEADGRIHYQRSVDLVPGTNVIRAVVRFVDGQQVEVNHEVTYSPAPTVTVETPMDGQVVGPEIRSVDGAGANEAGLLAIVSERPIEIRGHVDQPVVSVTVNQQLASLDPSGTQFELSGLLLHEGSNQLSISAADTPGRVGTTNLSVYVDQTAPLLTIEGPGQKAISSRSRIDVRGVVNDAVAGAVNVSEPVVTVTNTGNAQSVSALVADRHFIAIDVPLEVGSNRLVVVAQDALGNSRQSEVWVTRIATGSNRITELSGNRQTALIRSQLPRPLELVAMDAQGLPLANLPVRFDIVRGAGMLSPQAGAAPLFDGVSPARNLLVNSDANGRAQVWLSLGSEAAPAGNVVRAWSEKLSEDVLFTATGTKAPPKWVLVNGASGSQFAQTDSTPLDALTAIVLDDASNRLVGMPVIFAIEQGDARFTDRSAIGGLPSADGKSITVNTDKNGLASVRPLTGGQPGSVRVRAKVMLDQASSLSHAVFQIMVLERRDGPTGFAGTVLDHTGAPIEGVQLSIGGTALSTVSDAVGRFRFDDQVPTGKIELFVDGRQIETTQNGQLVRYPALSFETAIIQGQSNQLPHAIYLPPIQPARAQVVGGNEDVHLTIPGFDGFEMIVKANSVTFPDGTHVGPLVVSPVHSDRLPMVPPGAAGAFAGVGWTLQPTGTRFDPPIEVHIPNVMGMHPGETAPIFQWDHDLAVFLPMGNGTITEDATQLVSDPGTGITKAGWGGGGPPPPPPNCGVNQREPSVHSQEINVFRIKRRLGFLWEYEERALPERLSTNYPTKFTVDANPFRCDSVAYERDFGEDGPLGFGKESRYHYEERGERTVISTIRCSFTRCEGTQRQIPFNQELLVRVRDEDWIEYREMLTECGWDIICWMKADAQELLQRIEETLLQTEFDWSDDVRQWNSDKLNDIEQGAGLTEAEVTTLAVLYAANTALFPTSVLDLLPGVGRGVKALSKAKRLGASADELAKMAPQVVEMAQESAEVLVRWKRLERAAANHIAAMRPAGTSNKIYFPTRGGNKGFDGAVVYRDTDGVLQVTIGESKAWAKTTGQVKASDLSAFGLRVEPDTLRVNRDALKSAIGGNPPPGSTMQELEELFLKIDSNDFDVVLHGLPDTRIDEAGITAALRALGVRNVEFRRIDV